MIIDPGLVNLFGAGQGVGGWVGGVSEKTKINLL